MDAKLICKTVGVALRLLFIPSWENRLRAYICAQQSTAHPPVSEEVERYKNNFVFLRVPDLSFQEVEE
jgi:hypothetical protein